MKKISIILAAILCASSPLLASEGSKPATEQTLSSMQLGKDSISSIRKAYESGEYDLFFTQMDADYQDALSQNGLKGLGEMRPTLLMDTEDLQQKIFNLQQTRNQDLLNVIPETDDSLFAQKVRSVTATLSTPEQRKAIIALSEFQHLAPNSGKNGDENRFIEIDLEYEYKLIHLASNSDTKDRKAKQIALRMEKMDRMTQAAISCQDANLKQAVAFAAANFDERLAQTWDAADLDALAKGRVQPTNDLEKKVATILVTYQDQVNQLTTTTLNEKTI